MNSSYKGTLTWFRRGKRRTIITHTKNIQDKLKERDAERERNITKRMKQYEQEYDFINKTLLEQITEITHSDPHRTTAEVKSADKMVMLPTLFDGMIPELAKQHYKRFNQYIKFQTKNGNINDPIVRLQSYLNIL